MRKLRETNAALVLISAVALGACAPVTGTPQVTSQAQATSAPLNTAPVALTDTPVPVQPLTAA